MSSILPFFFNGGMGEGVSLSLPRKEVPRDNHLPSVITVSFTREHDSYVVSVPVSSRSANGAGISVLGTREHGSDPFPRDHDLFVESNMSGFTGTRLAKTKSFRDTVIVDDPDVADLSLEPHEGVKAFPTAVMSSVTKMMSSPGSSVNGYELGSPDPVDGGNGGRFGSGLTSESGTRQQGVKVMSSAETSGITKSLSSFGYSVNRPEPGSPDPVDGGKRGWFGRGKSSVSVTETV